MDAPPSRCWLHAIPDFLPFARDQIARDSDGKLSDACTPVFTLLGCRWKIELFANRMEEHAVGFFLRYIDCAQKPIGDPSPPVVFRIVVFHRDVVAETDAINEARKRQHHALVELQANQAASTSAQAVRLTPPGEFVPKPYPTHDPRNIEFSLVSPHSFKTQKGVGRAEFVPHNRLAEYCCGSSQSLRFCVMIQHPSQTRIRALNSLRELTDASDPQRLPYFGLKTHPGFLFVSSQPGRAT